MSRLPTLRIDVNADPWAILSTLPLDRALGLPVDEPASSEASLAYLLTPRCGPGQIAEPVALDVAGTTPATWMHRRRGFAPATAVDLVVAPAIADVLAAARLLPHARMDVLATVYSSALTGVRSRKYPAPVPMVWIWWTVDWDTIDFASSRFAVYRRDGTSSPAAFECREDFDQVVRRAARAGFVVLPTELHALAPILEADVDLWPLPEDRWRISSELADTLRSAGVRGVVIDD